MMPDYTKKKNRPPDSVNTNTAKRATCDDYIHYGTYGPMTTDLMKLSSLTRSVIKHTRVSVQQLLSSTWPFGNESVLTKSGVVFNKQSVTQSYASSNTFERSKEVPPVFGT